MSNDAWGDEMVSKAGLGAVQAEVMARGTSADGDFVFHRVVIPVGGRTSWHTHPGPQMVVVVAGHLVRESKRWPATEAGPGDGLLEEPGDVHAGINVGDVPVELWAMSVVPVGADVATSVEVPDPSYEVVDPAIALS